MILYSNPTTHNTIALAGIDKNRQPLRLPETSYWHLIHRRYESIAIMAINQWRICNLFHRLHLLQAFLAQSGNGAVNAFLLN